MRGLIEAATAGDDAAFATLAERHRRTVYRAFALDVLTIEDGEITALTAFEADLFPAFGLPATL